MLAVDPGSNVMGWALFDGGKLVRSGKVKTSTKQEPHLRVIDVIEKLCDETQDEVDAVCVEKLFKYNAALIWSVGALIQAKKPVLFIEVPTRVWQALTDDSYVKDDERDAVEIGKAVIHHAREI